MTRFLEVHHHSGCHERRKCHMCTIPSYFINVHVSGYWSHIFVNFVFKLLINLSATTNFFSLCAEYISISLFSNHDFIDQLQTSLPLSTNILFNLRLGSSKNLELVSYCHTFSVFGSNKTCISTKNIGDI